MFGVERRAAVRLLVLGAVGGGTGETGAGGGTLHPGADVTPHHLLTGGAGRGGGAPVCARRSGPGRRNRKSGGAVASLFELVGDEGEDFVDAELRTLGELVLAQGTGADGAGRPIAPDARLGRDRGTGEGDGTGGQVRSGVGGVRQPYLAEVVSTRRGHGFVKQVQTDGAGELLLGEQVRGPGLRHASPLPQQPQQRLGTTGAAR